MGGGSKTAERIIEGDKEKKKQQTIYMCMCVCSINDWSLRALAETDSANEEH